MKSRQLQFSFSRNDALVSIFSRYIARGSQPIDSELAANTPDAKLASSLRDRAFRQKLGYGSVVNTEGNKLTIAPAGKKKVVDSFVERV